MSATDVDDAKYFFVHLHKTAGTSLWRRMSHHFEAHEMYPSTSDGSPLRRTVAVDDLVERWPSRRAEVRVLAGHFPLCLREILAEEFVVFTLLRDPVERVLSALREQRQKLPEFAEKSFEEIYFDPLRHAMHRNHMVKMFGMRPDEQTDGLLTRLDMDERHVERALSGLDSCDAVGFQSDFDAFCAHLEQRYEWDLGPSRVENASDPVDMSDGIVEIVTADNALDIAFYEAACARFGGPLSI